MFGFIGGISKHNTLITGTNVFYLDGVDTLSNIRRLFFDSNDDIARLVIETFGWIVITNVFDGVADDLFIVDRGGGGNFTKDHDHAGLATRLTCHT